MVGDLMLNQWTGMGRLVRDPELKTTQSGVARTTFTLAVDHDYKSPGGQRGVDFIDIQCWRKLAEFANSYLAKGQMVCVAGRLQASDYTDREGTKRRYWSILANDIYFADSKKADRPPMPETPPPGYGGSDSGSQFAAIEDDDGELPF